MQYRGGELAIVCNDEVMGMRCWNPGDVEACIEAFLRLRGRGVTLLWSERYCHSLLTLLPDWMIGGRLSSPEQVHQRLLRSQLMDRIDAACVACMSRRDAGPRPGGGRAA